MNENIDLTKILDGCPKGTEFYHSGYGRVWFVGIDLYSDHPIKLSTAGAAACDYVVNVNATAKGTLTIFYDGECLLFPSKDQRDWSKFERFWDKPKVEKFDPKTLQPFDKVLVRDQRGQDWRTELFSHIDDTVNRVVCCWFWKQCIPYNENTKHLVGTNNDCPEYYKWWEE